MNTAMMPQSIALPQRPPGRHYCVQMTTIRRRRALLCCAGIALLAPAGAFHALTPSLKANNIRSSTCSSVLHDAVSVLNSTPASRTTAASCRTTTSRCQGAPKLSAAGGSGSDSLGEKPYYTPADLDAYSAPWGITLHYRGTLNTYRIEAHRPDGEVAGYTTGFYLGELLHLDKVQIQRKASEYEPGAPNAPAPGTRDLPWAAKTGNLFQLGAVLGCAAVRYGWDRGARRVELLAIRENEKQHSRLVRYYRIAGFRAERDVGEDLGSLKDRLLWGAEGTLMEANADEFMRRWTPLMLDTTSNLTPADATAGEKQEA